MILCSASRRLDFVCEIYSFWVKDRINNIGSHAGGSNLEFQHVISCVQMVILLENFHANANTGDCPDIKGRHHWLHHQTSSKSYTAQ
jgi:hypothetical protein